MEQHTTSSGSNFSEIDDNENIENQNLDFDENKSENSLRSWVNTEGFPTDLLTNY